MAGRNTTFDFQVKVAVIGESGVGKTCLLLRYANDSFNPTLITSIAADFKVKNIQLDGKRIKLQIWDLQGQVRFRTIATSYFRGAQGFLLVYDITDRNSFNEIRTWVAQMQMHADRGVPVVMVGCKCDCEHVRAVSTEEGAELAEEYGIHIYEVSAKADINVEKSFVKLAEEVKNYLLSEEGIRNHRIDTIQESFQKVATELRISGAVSWYNKHKINGRYAPIVENGRDLFLERTANGGYKLNAEGKIPDPEILCYRNLDSMGSNIYYTSEPRSAWIVKKNNKILARVLTNSYKTLPAAESLSGTWIENYGIYFHRMYAQKSLKCVNLQVQNGPDVKADVFAVAGDGAGTINMDLFAEYSKEPENLGLTIPMFVKYCRIKIANLDLEFTTLKAAGSQDLQIMQQVSTQKQEIERACKVLLKSVGMEDNSVLEPTAAAIIGAIEALVPELERYFEQLLDVDNGNFEVAKRCRDTKLQLEGLLSKLRPAPPAVAPENLPPTPPPPSQSPSSSAAPSTTETTPSFTPSSTPSTSAPLSSKEVVTGAFTSDAAHGGSNHNTAAERIVRDDKQRWTCRIDKVGWMPVHERENRTAHDIAWKCTITTGMSATKSIKLGAALSGGMATICAQLHLDMAWSSSATKQTEHEHNLTIAPNSRLVVEQEIIEGCIMMESRQGIWGKTSMKEEKFKIAKDSLRMQSALL